MVDVILGLGPVVLAAIYFFGLSAILIILAATAGAAFTEFILPPGGQPRGRSLKDGSAVLTGILMGLCLPPAIPMWMAFLGGAAGIGLGKLAFGGLGQNLFNPALVGRAFLQAAFPQAITTWSSQGTVAEFSTIRPSNFALPFMQPPPPVDTITTATPLGMFKFEGQAESLNNLLVGNTAGSLGETCAILILICGLILAIRRTFDWRIPLSILATVGIFSLILWLLNGERFATPLHMLTSGGLLFGAVYMATDPVTSPIAPRGTIVFGIGIGLLVVLIRNWGGLPEGVMYAILLMNAATPLIERVGQPRAFGRTEGGKAVAS